MTAARGVRTRREGDLLWVVLDDPRRANALSPGVIDELAEIYGRPWRREGVRAVLLRAEGRHFSAGADLAHLRSLQGAGRAENLRDSQRLRELFESVLRQDALTVALVQGACVAGGCGLATAHDFVLAARDARFMYSEARIGFVAALVATFLRLRVRGSDLRELLLDPRFLDAERAAAIGLVNRVVEPEELVTAGEDLATGILERASSESIARTKALLLELPGRSLDEALARAAEANAAARETEDCKRGIAAFLETKAPPTWR